jgi:uncharacterized protein YwgA
MKKRAGWPLLALYFAGEKGLTPAQLQKSIFLLQKAFPKADKLDYDFQPYNYGPFGVDVYRDTELLANYGLAEMHQKNGVDWNTYHITSSGQKKAAGLAKKIEVEIGKYLPKLIKWVQSISFQTLIGSIYKKYPEYKVNSIFKK